MPCLLPRPTHLTQNQEVVDLRSQLSKTLPVEPIEGGVSPFLSLVHHNISQQHKSVTDELSLMSHRVAEVRLFPLLISSESQLERQNEQLKLFKVSSPHHNCLVACLIVCHRKTRRWISIRKSVVLLPFALLLTVFSTVDRILNSLTADQRSEILEMNLMRKTLSL
jgi:hypothetical protein